MNCSINEEIERHLSLNRASYLEGLKEFISIPSVSAKGTGMTECAEWLAKAMQELDIKTEILPTAGSPAVYGELSKGTSYKTQIGRAHV
jgi:acetylornithine deacetylase/succinyl-diaminopimelate desuccinylase-like protein